MGDFEKILIFGIGEGRLFPRDIENIKHSGSHAIAWAAIVTSVSKVSYDLQVKSVAYSSTLEPDNILYLSDYQIIHSIIFVI